MLAKVLNGILAEPETTPEWLTEGKTVLIPKTKETANPKNYRPITCLPTTYKTLTAILLQRISKYLQENNLFPEEQKGCCKG